MRYYNILPRTGIRGRINGAAVPDRTNKVYFGIPSPQNEFSRNVNTGWERERNEKRRGKEMKGQKKAGGQGLWEFRVRGGKNPRRGEERK